MFFLTTAIDYTNGSPHIGHAYEKVLADVIARYRRLCGDEVFFLTGVDQHGQKVQQSAEARGVDPEAYVREITARFVALWEKLGVQYDGWAETIDPRHKACVRAILSDLHAKGALYKKSVKALYSVRQEQYLTDRDRDADGGFGPEWGEVVEMEEENWYYKLSDHTAWLLGHIDSTPDFILPAFRKNELRNAVERSEGIDLCISRPRHRFQWGIEFPFDPDYVTYVWFDALINYISFAGYRAAENADLPDFDRVWNDGPRALHIIGKDILVPAHGIYWPCMLKGIGFPDDRMPQLLVHGWWNIRGEKMSKSLGNIVDPDALADRFGSDAVRYYLVRDITTGRDADFDPERLVMLYNTELANELGNLCNRALNMTKRFTGGILTSGGEDHEEDSALRHSLATATAAWRAAMDKYDVAAGLEAINRHVVHCNGYAERTKPWELKKEPARAPRLARVLQHLAESVAHAAVMLSPVLPDAAAKLAGQLNRPELMNLNAGDLQWGLLPDGHAIQKPSPVFPRILTEPTAD